MTVHVVSLFSITVYLQILIVLKIKMKNIVHSKCKVLVQSTNFDSKRYLLMHSDIKGSTAQNSHRKLPVTSFSFARPRQHRSCEILWTTKSNLNPIMKQMPITNQTRSVKGRPLHQEEDILTTTEMSDIYTSFEFFLPNFSTKIWI